MLRTLLLLVVALIGLASSVSAQSQPQPTPCFRWSGQVALGNGPNGGNSSSTLWYYGGEAKTDPSQTDNLWTNALVSLDLTKDWATGTPPLTLVSPDSGNYASPPAVALGALWTSADGSNLYVYGGELSDSPSVAPPAMQVYQYSISSSKWSAIPTSGDNVTRPAEGSAALVPNEGTNDNMGFYFSGHEDDHTTQGWSNQIPRIYLNSLVTFDLGSKTFKNITNYSSTGATSSSSQPQSNVLYRADGTLTYVPGLGTNGKGILVAIGGATNSAYVDNSVLDIYDIGAQGWTKQAIGGSTMGSRINHCAVRASANVNGVESHQIYVYGGQQLNQTDRDSAMYILNIQNNQYTWVFVGDNLSSQPTGRAGHQCVLEGSQLIVIGGLVATNTICEQPGVFVYDTSQSAWSSNFKSGTLYSTPSLLSNITGGTGSSSDPTNAGSGSSGSNSGSGSGGSGSSSKTNIGAIVGGVVGGVVAIALLALLALCLLRRRRRNKRNSLTPRTGDGILDVSPMPSSHGDHSSGSMASPNRGPLPLGHDSEMKQPFMQSTNGGGGGGGGGGVSYGVGYNALQNPADDNVEDSTRGMEAAFANPHLVPKRTLRVVNRDDEDD